MSTIQSITLGVQQQVPGIVIPVTVTVSGSAPTYLTAQFRDVIHNTADSACQKITNFTEGATVDGVTTFTASLEMSETTASQIFGTDFTPQVQVTVFRGAVHSGALSGLYWFSPMQNVTFTSAPGGEKITLYIEADENYINDANLANLIAQVTYAANGASSVTRNVAVTPVEGNNHRWTAVLDDLVNGVEYELNVGLENDFGVGNSDTTISEMPSFNPSTVSIESFDSLDVSGGRFRFKCAAFDYSDYTQLNLKIKLTQGDIVEEASIDICGNSPTINEFSIVEYLKEESEIVSGQFKVEAFIEGVIDIDSSANVLALRTYGGAKASRNYIQDVNMPNPVVTLSEIDWVSGTQTVKAVVDGSFANVTFVFDLSGSVASTTEYDICNNQMIVTKEYSYATLNNYDGVRVSVSASRPELNGGATRSVTDEVDMNFDLMAIKRAPAPEVAIDLLYGNVGGAILTFANIDASFTSLLGEITLGDEVKVETIVEDTSGVMELSSELLVPGNRYLVSGYSRLHLTDAGYAARYSELNENDVHLLSAATSSQYVYSGTPSIFLSYRPRDASTNIIDTVRLEGDKSANNVSQIMALARDVSGQVQQATLTVGPETTDSCGNRLFFSALVDRAGNYTHDFTFTKALDLAEETQFAFGLLDTPTALDAITTTITNIEDALTFVSAVSAYNTALSAYTVALDLSSNPTHDETYQGHVTAIANYDISINDLSNAILAHTIVRDGSNSGSLWFKDQKSALYDLAVDRYSVAIYNTGAVAAAKHAFLTELANKTPAEEVEFQQTVQEVTLQFLDEANDISYQTITVDKYPSTDAYYNAESALEQYLVLTQTKQADSLVARNSASTVKNAAVEAHINIVDAISTKSGLRNAAIANKASAVTDRNDRQAFLASDAADKKVILLGANGRGTAPGCATKVLSAARVPFLA